MSKYTIKELVDDKELMSHMFLECVPREKLKEIADKSGDWKENNYSIEVEMIIDGHSIDPRPFFKLFYDQYETMVKKEAEKLFNDAVVGKVRNMIDMLNNYENIVHSWEHNINWKVKNPFEK